LKATEHNIAALLFDAIRESITASEILEIVVIGTGKIAELFAAYRPKRVRLRFAAHKNFLKAKELATLAAGEAISFRELPAALLRADVLISATSSPHFILSQENLLQIAAGRPRPIYIYDLAIPRDIEPQDRWLENIVLKNLDDLSPVFQAHNLKIQEKLEKAQYFIEEAVAHYAREIKAGHTAKPFSFAAS
jgi:glutamyl-tRNA reductase